MKTRLLVIGLAATATLVGCATSQPQYGSYRGDRGYDQGYPQTQRCVDCGIVTRIDEVGPTRTAPTGTGAVLGGIVGVVGLPPDFQGNRRQYGQQERFGRGRRRCRRAGR